MKISTVDHKQAKVLAKAMKDAMEKVAKDFGMKVERGNGKFTQNSLKIPFTLVTVDEGGAAQTKTNTALKMYYPNLEGKVVTIRTKRLKIVGYNSRAPKFPFEAVDIKTNKPYKLTRDVVMG